MHRDLESTVSNIRILEAHDRYFGSPELASIDYSIRGLYVPASHIEKVWKRNSKEIDTYFNACVSFFKDWVLDLRDRFDDDLRLINNVLTGHGYNVATTAISKILEENPEKKDISIELQRNRVPAKERTARVNLQVPDDLLKEAYVNSGGSIMKSVAYIKQHGHGADFYKVKNGFQRLGLEWKTRKAKLPEEAAERIKQDVMMGVLDYANDSQSVPEDLLREAHDKSRGLWSYSAQYLAGKGIKLSKDNLISRSKHLGLAYNDMNFVPIFKLDELETIINTHTTAEGRMNEALRLLKTSGIKTNSVTLGKYWNALGLHKAPAGLKPELTDALLREARDISHGISSYGVQYISQHGIKLSEEELRKRSKALSIDYSLVRLRALLTVDNLEVIISTHKTSDGHLSEAIRLLKESGITGTVATIKKYWSALGLQAAVDIELPTTSQETKKDTARYHGSRHKTQQARDAKIDPDPEKDPEQGVRKRQKWHRLEHIGDTLDIPEKILRQAREKSFGIKNYGMRFLSDNGFKVSEDVLIAKSNALGLTYSTSNIHAAYDVEALKLIADSLKKAEGYARQARNLLCAAGITLGSQTLDKYWNVMGLKYIHGRPPKEPDDVSETKDSRLELAVSKEITPANLSGKSRVVQQDLDDLVHDGNTGLAKARKEFSKFLNTAYINSGHNFNEATKYFRRNYFPIRKKFMISEYERLKLKFNSPPASLDHESNTYPLNQYSKNKATQAMVRYLYGLCDGNFFELKQTLEGEGFVVKTAKLKDLLVKLGLSINERPHHVNPVVEVTRDIQIVENLDKLKDIPKDVVIADDPTVNGKLDIVG